MISVSCKHCSSEFDNYPSNDRKYCSRACYWADMKGNQPKIKYTDAERQRRRERMTGDKNPMWKGGDSDKERRNSAYKNWRIAVFERDGYVCQSCGYFNGCGKKRRDLNAHHIVPWIESIELRYEVENGKTLCVPCHIKEHQGKEAV